MSEHNKKERESDDVEAGLAALGALSASRLRNAALAATALTLAAGVLASALHADTGSRIDRSGGSTNPFAEQYNETEKVYVPPASTSADDLRGRSEADLKARFDDVQEGLWDDWSHDLPKGYFAVDEPMDPELKKAVTRVAVLDKTRGFDPGVFGNPYPHGSGTTPMPANGVIGGLGGASQGEKQANNGGGNNGRPVRGFNPRATSPVDAGERWRGGGRPRSGPGVEPEGDTSSAGGVPIGVIIGTLPDLVMPLIRDGQGGGVLPSTPFVQVPEIAQFSKDERFDITDPGAEVPIPAPAFLFPAGLALLRWKRRRAAKV